MLKSWDINLRQSEKKTLFSFLTLYLVFTIIILLAFGVLYYQGQKDIMLQEERLKLSDLANEQALKLKSLHVNFDKQRTYPRSKHFQSAIFDSAHKEIFSTFDTKDIDFEEVIYLEDGYIYLIKEPESYYLGTKYLVLQVPSQKAWKQEALKTLLAYSFLVLLVMTVMGYFLLRLLLKPMRDAIVLLDRFIKDTTHELNTPVNAIISNIEMIDKTSLDEKLAKKIKRIDIGARTVSNLYQDLTYLTLAQKIVSHNEEVNICELIRERLEYFSLFADSRKLTCTAEFHGQKYLYVDRKKMAKLIDNLLSNAIKYNKIGGSVHVEVDAEGFCVQDSGRGIAQDKVNEMFTRYSRADNSVGGFGIGLSIVAMIAQEYNLGISVDSQEGKYTKVCIRW